MQLFGDLPKGSDAPPVDVHSASQFARADLDRLFALTRRMREIVDREGGADLLERRLLAAAFFEPSTRTASSFLAAMERLGGRVIPMLHGADATSASKGESLADTMRTFSQYADAIVLRHPRAGSAPGAAEAATVPFLNAGDGSREHPTQALLDVFTMADELGTLDGRTVALVGDLKYGRTVHSLAEMLGLFDVSVDLVSPEALRLPESYRGRVSSEGVSVRESAYLEDVLPHADVLYMTRIQEERFDDAAEFERHADAYTVDREAVARMPKDAILMHPLPRIGEIAADVDDDPRAVYFRQVRNGMYVRMALLADRIADGGISP
jgi:carbamoyl-phosphate synthase/aspartate carbamoyltransferase/dihydroorotase/carbamoyl-phosphate synthase/aspartate carbamoyltransferase